MTACCNVRPRLTARRFMQSRVFGYYVLAPVSLAKIRNAVKNRWLTLEKTSLKAQVLEKAGGELSREMLEKAWRSLGCERFNKLRGSRAHSALPASAHYIYICDVLARALALTCLRTYCAQRTTECEQYT